MQVRHERKGIRPFVSPKIRTLTRAVQLAAAFALVGGLAVGGAFTTPLAASAVTGDEVEAVPTPENPAELVEVPNSTAAEGAENSLTPDVVSSDELAATPFTVVPPPAGAAVISVRVGGDRVSGGAVNGLAGVTLGLYEAGTASTGGGGASASNIPAQGSAGGRHSLSWSWTTCVSDADGDCNFVIPIRAGSVSPTGAPQDTRFWIVQESVPAGWYANPNLRVGTFGASPEGAWQYRFRTDTQLRANTTYRSTDAMPWNDTADAGVGSGDPDRFFMRNRVDSNAEGWYGANVTRTTGLWSQSRNNPAFPAQCGLDIALIADTSGSLGATGIASLKSTMGSFVDAFRGTDTNMSLYSFSNESPGSGATNHPNLLPITTAVQANAFKAQYSGWLSGGGTNWDRGFAEAANATSKYDLAILLTDGNPTVIRNNSTAGSSAYNSLQDVDAGIFSANQLKAEGTRILALGIGSALTTSSELNLRAVSGPAKGADYFKAADFTEATAALVALASASCQGSIGVQKMIVPSGGAISDAVAAPAGWQFDASTTASGVAIQAPASQATTDGGEGKVSFGLTFAPPSVSGNVQILETQQAGYSIVPVGTGSAARNAVCVNAETGGAVSVTNAGTTANPGFVVQGQKSVRVECKIYNRAPAPGKIEVAKTANPVSGTQVTPGQSVTYTLTFRNTGGAPIAVAHDDVLTDVLDDATLQGTIVAQSPLAAVLNTAGDRILITGTLAPGDVKTVSYTFKVKDPLSATSNGKLGNYVVKTGVTPPTTCVPTDPCTVHPIVGSLIWNKVDATNVKLAGSEWTLTPYNAQGQLVPADTITVIDCVAASTAACTGADKDPQAGEFLLEKLKLGKYQLVETKAPAGFQILPSPIEVVVNTNVSLGNIKNLQIEVPPIPLTGGVGSYLFWGSAGGTCALIVAALWYQRRRTQVLSE